MQPKNVPPPSGWDSTTVALVVVALLLVTASGVYLYARNSSYPGASSVPPPPVIVPPGPPANANLTTLTSAPVLLTNGRLGVNARADQGLSSADAGAINATGARLVRWPGGALGDRFDPLGNSGAGLIYNENGTPSAPKASYSQFVTWCGWVHCQSIVTLPAEVDNASLAAAIVTYSLRTLEFAPTFWEIGNEPLQWTHFGIPWVAWNSTQEVEPTPLQFADLVQSYVTAIRTVDPTTPIIGIGGVGAGNSQGTWITQDVATNGPNLSGVAVHVYPAGNIASPEAPATWFASLQGESALPARVNGTISEAAGACPSCTLSVFVDELGTGTLVPAGDEIAGGYLASYVSAEILQSLSLEVASADYYNLQSDTPGAWFSSSGAPSAAYFAYENWAQLVGPYGAPVGVNSSSNGLLAAVGGATAETPTNLILVNTNSTYTFSLDVEKTFPGVAHAAILAWNGSSPSPVNMTWGPGGPTNFTVPPMSLAIFSNAGPAVLNAGPAAHEFRGWALSRGPVPTGASLTQTAMRADWTATSARVRDVRGERRA